MKKTLIIAAVAVVGVTLLLSVPTVGYAVATATTAGSGEEFFGGKIRAKIRAVFSKLGLSSDQKTQIRSTLIANAPQLRPLIMEIIQERRELVDLIHSGTATDEQVKAQVDELAKVMKELAVERNAIAKQVRNVLTPEQIEAAQAIKTEFREKVDAHLEKAPLLNGSSVE